MIPSESRTQTANLLKIQRLAVFFFCRCTTFAQHFSWGLFCRGLFRVGSFSVHPGCLARGDVAVLPVDVTAIPLHRLVDYPFRRLSLRTRQQVRRYMLVHAEAVTIDERHAPDPSGRLALEVLNKFYEAAGLQVQHYVAPFQVVGLAVVSVKERKRGKSFLSVIFLSFYAKIMFACLFFI